MKTLQILSISILTINTAVAQLPGTLDTSFNKTGIVTNNTFIPNSMLLQSDGKILLGGQISENGGNTTSFGTLRYNSNGSIDNTFGTNGINKQSTTTNQGSGEGAFPLSLCIQSNGKILQGGDIGAMTYENSQIGRYNLNGSLNKSVFMPTGGSNDVVTLIKQQNDGSIISVIESNSTYKLIKLDTALKVDNTFNPPTTGFTTYKAIAIQSDNKTLIIGKNTTGFGLTRYRADWTKDITFGTSSIVETKIGTGVAVANAMAIQSDGKIILVGTSSNVPTNNDIALARYNTNGTIDNTFGTSGIVTTDFSTANEQGYNVVIQSNGQIIVAGGTDFNGKGEQPVLIRYNTNGSIDTSFNKGKVIITYANVVYSQSYLQLQNNNKIVISSGTFIARYNADTTAKTDTTHHATGIKNINNSTVISVYPNPSNGEVVLKINSDREKTTQLEIVNVLGEVVERKRLTLLEGLNTVNLSITSKGLYLVKMRTENRAITSKFVVE